MVQQKKEKVVTPKGHFIECVVWDLDNTLWDGFLLENEKVVPFGEAVQVIRCLDRRGILHSIASNNDHDLALARLKEIGLLEYFLCPQINWHSKATSIHMITQYLHLNAGNIAFVDDQAFERDHVSFSMPEVLCVDAKDVGRLLDMPETVLPFKIRRNKRKRQLLRRVAHA